MIPENDKPRSNRFLSLMTEWGMDWTEFGGCFGSTSRSARRWIKAEKKGDPSLHDSVYVLLRHYEDGQTTAYRDAMIKIRDIRTGHDSQDIYDDEADWVWEAEVVGVQVEQIRASVTMPGYQMSCPWGVRWIEQRRSHLAGLQHEAPTFDEKKDLRGKVIDRYDELLAEWSKRKK